MSLNSYFESVRQYFDKRITEYGPTVKGIDALSQEDQELRSEQLLKCFSHKAGFSVNDYGCGYGAFLDYLTAKGYKCQYRGFDISKEMIVNAEELHAGTEDACFTTDESSLTVADYTVASGVFTMRQEANDDELTEMMLHILKKISELSEKGFAFNALSKYVPADLRYDDLYYADPLFVFDYCRKEFSDYVVLLHDYMPRDFTILVRKEIEPVSETL